MMSDERRWNVQGIFYAVTLTLTISLILSIAKLAHITDSTWALISAVICTELNLGQVRQIIVMRILATIVGATIAVAVLMIMGPGFATILIGVILITLLCHYFMRVGNWKLAVATSVIVLVVGLNENSIHFAEHVAIQRALEVIAGSVTAGIVSAVAGKLGRVLQVWRKG